MYGEDRLTRPLLRMKDGKYSKDGEFTPISWNQAFDIMAEKWKAALKAEGPGAIGMFGSGQWTIFEGLRRLQADEGRLPLPTTWTPTPATAWPRR